MLKAIGFDLFGTLLQVTGDSAVCLRNLFNKLVEQGIIFPFVRFLEIYREIHTKHRAIKQSMCKEISNQEELSEILKQVGYNLDPASPIILEAVKAYFSTWDVVIMEGAESTLRHLRKRFETGVITNFTDSKFTHKLLTDLGLLDLFGHVVISAEVGWRKPSPRIFNEFLQLMRVRAGETLFIGDDINYDVVGAKAIGMKTVLLTGENYDEQTNLVVQPDFKISSMKELNGVITDIMEKQG